MLILLAVGSGSIFAGVPQIHLTHFEPDTSRKKMMEISSKLHAIQQIDSLSRTRHANQFSLLCIFIESPCTSKEASTANYLWPAIPVQTHLRAVRALHLSVPLPAQIDFPHSCMPVSAVREAISESLVGVIYRDGRKSNAFAESIQSSLPGSEDPLEVPMI